MTNKKPFGKTIRQEVINAASLKLRIMRREPAKWALPHDGGPTPCDAIESVIDGAKVGTLGGLMRDYVLGAETAACRRLECEIERSAK